jgi:penicillin V acylase-like amidase (Ntn superfamily)
MIPNHGYRYLALYSAQAGTVNGVNSEGLAGYTLSSPDGLDSTAKSQPAQSTTATIPFDLDWIMEHYKSVDETIDALKRGPWVTHPEFYILADKDKVSYIEIGPNGKFAVQETNNGALQHANEFQEPSMVNLNPSLAEHMAEYKKRGFLHAVLRERDRLKKSAEQLASKSLLTMDDFKNFTSDPVVWYDDPPLVTVAAMVVQIRPNGDATVWAKIANPGAAPYEVTLSLKETLFGQGLPSKQ